MVPKEGKFQERSRIGQGAKKIAGETERKHGGKGKNPLGSVSGDNKEIVHNGEKL